MDKVLRFQHCVMVMHEQKHNNPYSILKTVFRKTIPNSFKLQKWKEQNNPLYKFPKIDFNQQFEVNKIHGWNDEFCL